MTQNILLETGPEGAALTQANSGASGSPSLGTGATAVFAAAAAKDGAFGARFTSSSVQSLLRYATEGSGNQQGWSFWVNFRTSIAPASTLTFFTMRYASGVVARIQLENTGRIKVGDVGGPTYTYMGAAGIFAANTWYRFEIQMTGGSTTTGVYTVKAYNAAGNQVGTTAASTSANLSVNAITNFDIGIQNGTTDANTVDYDSVRTQTGGSPTVEVGAYQASANTPPVVTASTPTPNPAVNSPVTLNGVATDSDGTISTVAWTFTSLPTGVGAPAITNAASAQATFTPVQSGLYVARFAATDNSGSTTTASVTIKVGGTTQGIIGVTSNPGGATTFPTSSSAPTVLSDTDDATYVEWPASPSAAALERFDFGPFVTAGQFYIVLGKVTISGAGSLAITAELFEGTVSRKKWTGLTATGADITLTLSAAEVATISDWGSLHIEVGSTAA